MKLRLILILILTLVAACGGAPDPSIVVDTVAADTSASDAFKISHWPRVGITPYEGCGCFTFGHACEYVPDMPQYACAAYEMSSGACPVASFLPSPDGTYGRIVGCCHSKVCAGDFRCSVDVCLYEGDLSLSEEIYACQAAGGKFDNIPVPPFSSVCGKP